VQNPVKRGDIDPPVWPRSCPKAWQIGRLVHRVITRWIAETSAYQCYKGYDCLPAQCLTGLYEKGSGVHELRLCIDHQSPIGCLIFSLAVTDYASRNSINVLTASTLLLACWGIKSARDSQGSSPAAPPPWPSPRAERKQGFSASTVPSLQRYE